MIVPSYTTQSPIASSGPEGRAEGNGGIGIALLLALRIWGFDVDVFHHQKG